MLAPEDGLRAQFPYKSAEEIFTEVAKVTPSYGGMTYERLEHRGALLALPDPRTPRHADPAQGEVHPPRRPRHLHADRVQAAGGGARRGVPADPDDGPLPLAVAHGHHDPTAPRSSSARSPTGWIEINPEDAKALGIKDKEMVRAKTRRGEVEVGARVTDEIKKGVVFMPFHYIECAANVLTNNALDPMASIPEFKACAVKVEKIAEA